MEDELAPTHGSPDVVQAPSDVPDAGATDPRETRAAPAETIAGTWVFIALVGIWVMLSPLVLSYQGGDSSANAVGAGALALAIGAMGLIRIEPRFLRFATLVLGAWLAASAAWLAESNIVRLDSLLMGLILIILSLVGLAAVSDRGKTRGV